MITLEQCKKILNKDKHKYNEDEIKQIRTYLYFIGGLQLELSDNELKN